VVPRGVTPRACAEQAMILVLFLVGLLRGPRWRLIWANELCSYLTSSVTPLVPAPPSL